MSQIIWKSFLVPGRGLETCQDKPHQNFSQEGVVDDVPEPAEVGENVVHRVRSGLQEVPHPSPELRCINTTKGDQEWMISIKGRVVSAPPEIRQ